MDLDPPALFFHPQEIQINLGSSFSVQLYGLKLKQAAAAHLDVRYDWGSVQIDSVVADTFFQSENDPVQIVIDEEGTLDIFIYLLAFCNTNKIDISEALINKMKKNVKKYPADEFNGHF